MVVGLAFAGFQGTTACVSLGNRSLGPGNALDHQASFEIFGKGRNVEIPRLARSWQVDSLLEGVGRDWKHYILHHTETLMCFQSAVKPLTICNRHPITVFGGLRARNAHPYHCSRCPQTRPTNKGSILRWAKAAWLRHLLIHRKWLIHRERSAMVLACSPVERRRASLEALYSSSYRNLDVLPIRRKAINN